MKKGSKPAIVVLVSFLLIGTAIVLIAVALRFKYEEFVRHKDELEKQLKAEQTKKVNLVANYQMLTTGEIIREYAITKLGMVNGNSPDDIVKINKDEIQKIDDYLKDKYE